MRIPLNPRGGSAMLLAVGAFALLGCARLPSTAPDPGIRDPQFVRVPVPGEGSFSARESGASSSPLETRTVVNGDRGGVATAGRFKIAVPAGAFAGDAEIHIRVPDSGLMKCELEISPAGKNSFAVPVLLVADCGGAVGVDPSKLTTLWYDETAGTWRNVGAQVDALVAVVTTPLRHFSTYGVAEGKAGW